jgi:sugar lactone lactonase YvrE
MKTRASAATLFVVIFLLGFVLMGFEMLGSRYIYPYFGGGLPTWAALISTVLAALMFGYFGGGELSDKFPSPVLLCGIVIGAALYLLIIPYSADPVLTWVMDNLGDGDLGVITSSVLLLFVPVLLLGMVSPFCIKLILRDVRETGRVSGFVYGISTMGNILGTLITSFYLIPAIGSRDITYIFGGTVFACGLILFALGRAGAHATGARVKVLGLVLLACCGAVATRAEAQAQTPAQGQAQPQDGRALTRELPSTVIETDTSNPESALWLGGKLYVTELPRDRVVVYDGQTRSVWFQEQGCGPASIRQLSDGGDLMILCHIGARLVRVTSSGRVVARFTHDMQGRALRDPNDGDADGEGGLYFSDSGLYSAQAPATGRVYYWQPDGQIRLVVDGMHYSNGVLVDRRNHRLLVSEHLGRRVLSFPIRPDHTLGNATVFFDLSTVYPPAYNTDLMGPDGLAMDENGNLFIAHDGAGRVLVVSSAGRLLNVFPVPMQWVTNVALSGDGFLFVTGTIDIMAPPFPGRVLRYTLPPPQ